MNSLQWYVIAVVGVIAAAGFWRLWYAAGAETRLEPVPEPTLSPEPTYKISECYGRHRTLEKCATGLGNTWEYHGPGVYYEVRVRHLAVKDTWVHVADFTLLSQAEACVQANVTEYTETSKVRPVWSYKKDGSPHP